MVELFKNEMAYLVQLALRDPKCYQLWFHRKWIHEKVWKVEKSLKQDGKMTRKFLEGDMKICDKFLSKDERNFHAWNYRSYIVANLMEKFPEDSLQIVENELSFLKTKLDANFSNYSAIHFKSKYLVLKERIEKKISSDEQVELSLELIKNELKFVWDGLFIAPFEQALWIYQNWLLSFYRVTKVLAFSKEGNKLRIQFNQKLKKNQFLVESENGEKKFDWEIVNERILETDIDCDCSSISVRFNSEFGSKRLLFRDTTLNFET